MPRNADIVTLRLINLFGKIYCPLKKMSLQHYLVISSILFTLGIFAVLTRKNAISILMGIELILNSCNLNFVAFSRFVEPSENIIGRGAYLLDGQIIAIFGIVLAAAEAAVFLAIILAIYREFGSIRPDEVDTLKG